MAPAGETYRFRTKDHPEAEGRQPNCGDVDYPLTFPLEWGRTLVVRLGQSGFDSLCELIDRMRADLKEGKV